MMTKGRLVVFEWACLFGGGYFLRWSASYEVN